MKHDPTNTLDKHTQHFLQIDEALTKFANEHGFLLEKNVQNQPCRILRKKGNPSYVIDIRQEGTWEMVPYRDDLPHTLAVIGFFVDRHQEYVYRKTEELSYFVHFQNILANLDKYLKKAFEFIESWPAEVIFREGSQSQHASVYWRKQAATGGHSMELAQLLYSIWQYYKLAKKSLEEFSMVDFYRDYVPKMREAMDELGRKINELAPSELKKTFQETFASAEKVSTKLANPELQPVAVRQALKLLYVWSGLLWYYGEEKSKTFPDIGGHFVVDPLHILLDCVGWRHDQRPPQVILEQVKEELDTSEVLPTELT